MSQIQHTSERSQLEQAIALTAATPTQIESFLSQYSISLTELMEDEVALELLAQQATQPNGLHDARAGFVNSFVSKSNSTMESDRRTQSRSD